MPSPPLPLPLRAVRALAALAAGAVLAVVIAFWGWRWLAPTPPVPAPPREAGEWARAIAASPIFGRASSQTPDAAVPQTTLTGDTRLLGVFAERDGRGYALFRLPGKGAVLVKSGETLTDGVNVVAVRPDGVRVDDHGELRDIVLRPGAPASAAVAPARTSATSDTAARSTCTLPAGYRGPVYRLNAELLTGLSAQPASWQSLVTPADGALVVREGNPLAASLGLSAGDRIAQANGIALARIDDVLNAVVQPLLASQPVRVTGVHNGKPAEWVLVNASACPV